MRTTYLKQTTIAVATIALLLGAAACTGDEEATPTLEPAPVGGVSDGGGDNPTTAEPETAAATEDCDPKEGGEALPNEAPIVDAWEDVEGTAAPTSEIYGPHARAEGNGSMWTCYEHSPTGALFATFYVFAALGNVDGVTEEWIADSAVKDQLIAAQESNENEGESEPGSMTPIAYRYVSYSPDKAVIDAVMEYGGESGTGYVSMRFPLIWVDDSWKIDGEQYIESRPTPLDSLDGYVRWSTDG